MFKFAGKVIDVYDDPSLAAKRLCRKIGLPSSEVIDQLPDDSFALAIKTAGGVQRRFPLTTAALVKAAALYFEAGQAELPRAARVAAAWRIKQAAERFKLPLTDAVVETTAALTPDAVRASGRFDAAELIDDARTVPDGYVRRLDKTAAFAAAQDEFLANYGRMTPAERALAAHELTKVGEVEDPRIYDYVPKARYGPQLGDGVRQRLALVRENSIKTAQLRELVRSFQDMPPKQAAVLLYQFDKAAGLDDRVLDAFLTCWGGFTKIAAATDPLSERQQRLVALARDQESALRSVLQPAAVVAFRRDPLGFYSRANKPLKKVLDALATQIGKAAPGPAQTLRHRDSLRHARHEISENRGASHGGVSPCLPLG